MTNAINRYFAVNGSSKGGAFDFADIMPGFPRCFATRNNTEADIVEFAINECIREGSSLEEIAGIGWIADGDFERVVPARPFEEGEKFKAALAKLNDDGRTYRVFNMDTEILAFLAYAEGVGLSSTARNWADLATAGDVLRHARESKGGSLTMHSVLAHVNTLMQNNDVLQAHIFLEAALPETVEWPLDDRKKLDRLISEISSGSPATAEHLVESYALDYPSEYEEAVRKAGFSVSYRRPREHKVPVEGYYYSVEKNGEVSDDVVGPFASSDAAWAACYHEVVTRPMRLSKDVNETEPLTKVVGVTALKPGDIVVTTKAWPAQPDDDSGLDVNRLVVKSVTTNPPDKANKEARVAVIYENSERVAPSNYAIDAMLQVETEIPDLSTDIAAVIEMAHSHIEDIDDGLADGMYEAEDNEALPAKRLAVERVAELTKRLIYVPVAESGDDNSNARRANRVIHALRAHAVAIVGLGDEEFSQSSLGSKPLVDLLTDIRHFCDARDMDFFKALEFSYEHYVGDRDDARDVLSEKADKLAASPSP